MRRRNLASWWNLWKKRLLGLKLNLALLVSSSRPNLRTTSMNLSFYLKLRHLRSSSKRLKRNLRMSFKARTKSLCLSTTKTSNYRTKLTCLSSKSRRQKEKSSTKKKTQSKRSRWSSWRWSATRHKKSLTIRSCKLMLKKRRWGRWKLKSKTT